jgi:hypothetical protein
MFLVVTGGLGTASFHCCGFWRCCSPNLATSDCELLAAPTGKAAARLKEVVKQAKDALGVSLECLREFLKNFHPPPSAGLHTGIKMFLQPGESASIERSWWTKLPWWIAFDGKASGGCGARGAAFAVGRS